MQISGTSLAALAGSHSRGDLLLLRAGINGTLTIPSSVLLALPPTPSRRRAGDSSLFTARLFLFPQTFAGASLHLGLINVIAFERFSVQLPIGTENFAAGAVA